MGFITHICESECNCKICKDYINKLDLKRQSISRGESKKKVIIRLVRTSQPNKVDEGERKFDLPKPRLSRPFSLSGVRHV